jgi:hypothetical protein
LLLISFYVFIVVGTASQDAAILKNLIEKEVAKRYFKLTTKEGP